jgi:hypothetical protein
LREINYEIDSTPSWWCADNPPALFRALPAPAVREALMVPWTEENESLW